MTRAIRIVLVEPREAGNVGAAARAMKNFGLHDLAVVGRHPQLSPLAGWWASGADDVVASAQFHDTLQLAIAGCHAVVATTSARGRTSTVDLDPVGVSQLCRDLLPLERMALVFGREDHGLTAEEISLCSHTASIPTNPEFPTMNLAQSVSLFAYELFTTEERNEASARLVRAEAAMLERLHERLQALLMESGYLHPRNPDRIYDEIRRWVSRMQLDPREAEVALGIVRQLEWKMRRVD
jgi:tRNA/rRNA methyltransferase